MANRKATRHVELNLLTMGPNWVTVGDRLAAGGREVFEQESKSWLRDNSELSSRTIDSADWDEVWQTFRQE